MHASIALCLMMVGGPVAPGPEPDIVFVPLRDDLTALNSMQELEWKTRLKNGYRLPRVPTLDDERSRADDARGMGRRYGSATDPNAVRRQQQQMPFAPTDPGATGQNVAGQGAGPMPGMPGSGMNQGTSQGYSQNGTGRFDPYSTDTSLNTPTGNEGGYGGLANAPRVGAVPTAADTLGGIMNRGSVSNYGVSPNPMLNANPGGADKPFSGYQRPNGYSPWMGLYNTPTNNGTVSQYTSSVQPAVQQQQYNQQLTEQIQGVRNSIVSPRGGGTPGMEMPVNGAGLANPYGYINYANPMGR
jgi:hypothetical protein